MFKKDGISIALYNYNVKYRKNNLTNIGESMSYTSIQPQISTDKFFDSKIIQATYQNMFSRKLKRSRTKRILLIEDDSDMSEVIQNRLRKMYNCVVTIATDPFGAIDMMATKYYDLIVLDWNLPALNGGETLRHADRAMAFESMLPIQWDGKAPVVVFSSSDQKDCRFEKAKYFNYVGHISKRQSLSKILTSIAEFMYKKPDAGCAAS